MRCSGIPVPQDTYFACLARAFQLPALAAVACTPDAGVLQVDQNDDLRSLRF